MYQLVNLQDWSRITHQFLRLCSISFASSIAHEQPITVKKFDCLGNSLGNMIRILSLFLAVSAKECNSHDGFIGAFVSFVTLYLGLHHDVKTTTT